MQGSKKNQGIAPLGNNFRPPQPLHNRLVRTNIDFNLRKVIHYIYTFIYFYIIIII
jgi:hypothetical protein